MALPSMREPFDIPANAPLHCACSTDFTVEHMLPCPKGGHNEIRDLTATLLSEVWHDVSTEPHLQSLTDEIMR